MKYLQQYVVLSALIIAACVAASGCSSVRGRGDKDFYPNIYPGTKYHENKYVERIATNETNDVSQASSLSKRKEVQGRITETVDFFSSLAADTALLPWDFIYSRLKKTSD